MFEINLVIYLPEPDPDSSNLVDPDTINSDPQYWFSPYFAFFFFPFLLHLPRPSYNVENIYPSR